MRVRCEICGQMKGFKEHVCPEHSSRKGLKLDKPAWNKGVKRWWKSPTFDKGIIPWNKGQVLKIQPTKLCVECDKEFCKSPKWSTKQWNERIMCSTECNKSYRHRTFKHSEESKVKIRKSIQGRVRPKGDKCWNWKGGITPIRKKQYFSKEYKDWRKSVFERDVYTCQECGDRGCELNADHIKPWAFYPELRFDIDNGRTLCVPCHRKTPTWGNRKLIEQNL